MRIISINLGFEGSTGKIVQGIYEISHNRNFEFILMAPWNKKFTYKDDIHCIGNRRFRKINAYLGAVTGLDGCFAFFATLKVIKRIKSFNPQIIHLHNIHNNYINIPLLFRYIKKQNMHIVWTLHDCWSFTGHCPHFIYEKCEKWKTGCSKCPRYKEYPKTLFDNSSFMWKLKRKWFTDIKKVTIVTPSKWLSNLVKESYLKEYQVRVINNGIDLNIFHYRTSMLREEYNLKDKKVILGVSFGWSNKKGLDVFLELSKSLPENYQIILVGTNEIVDKILPANIISIHKTNNQEELSEWYSLADVFVNPTREDTFPTVNLEALACGTPVITFNTGGSPECIDEKCGFVVNDGDYEELENRVRECVELTPFSREYCIKYARKYSHINRFEEYLELYEEAIKNENSIYI